MSNNKRFLPWQAYEMEDAYDVVDARGVVVANYVPSKDHANLIAAAPELLAALKELLPFTQALTDARDIASQQAQACARAESVIATAEGRE